MRSVLKIFFILLFAIQICIYGIDILAGQEPKNKKNVQLAKSIMNGVAEPQQRTPGKNAPHHDNARAFIR